MPKYKEGKQTRPIPFSKFEEAMQDKNFVKSKRNVHKSYLAFLYWFGVYRSEALERVKEDFQLKGGVLKVRVPAKRGGERDVPLQIDADMPYVNLIIKRLNKLEEGERVWPFSPSTAWRIVKRALGKKYYPAFFRLNRAIRFLNDKTTTIPEMKAWFGWKSMKPISDYVGYSERHVKAQRRRLRQEIEGSQ